MVTAAGHGDAIPFNHKLNAGQMGPRGNPIASELTNAAPDFVNFSPETNIEDGIKKFIDWYGKVL